MKLFLDENLSPQQAIALREHGYDVQSVTEVGLSGQPDSVIRKWAIENSRILITLDADFGNILRYPPSETPGVIRLRIHPPTEEAVFNELLTTLKLLAGISLKGCLVVSHRGFVRIRR